MRLGLSLQKLFLFALVVGAAVVAWAAFGHPPETVLALADLLTRHQGELLLGAALAPALSDSQVSTLNTIAADYLEQVDQDMVYQLIFQNNPELTLIMKNEKVGGLYLDQAVKYGGSQGVANNYANALGNQSPEQYATFHVPMTTFYRLATVGNQAIEAAKIKDGSFEEPVVSAVNYGIKQVANELSRYMMGSGAATIGQILAIQVSPPNFPAGSARVTLADPLQYQFFEYGMIVDSSGTTFGGAPLGAPDTVQVLAVDAAAQVLVMSAPINSSTGAPSGSWNAGYWVAGNYLFRDGNFISNQFNQPISTLVGGPGVSPAQFAGMGAWCPSYAYRQSGLLSAGTFFNVNRGNNGTLLAGLGINAGNVGVSTGLINAANQVAIYVSDEMAPEYVSLNPTSYVALLQELYGKTVFLPDEVTAKITYKFLTLEGGPKTMKIIRSRNVPPKTAYMWSPSQFELASTGPMPRVLPYAGMPFLPLPDDDSNQSRTGGYCNLVYKGGGGVANVTLQQ